MNKKRIWLAIALLIPIVALALNAYLKSMQRASGEEVVLPIEGFDPRDLLSGHYLTYRIDYGLEQGCSEHNVPASICLRPLRGLYPQGSLPEDCTLFIKGRCDDNAAFMAGIERFYIPEESAQVLEQKVQDKRGAVVLSVDRQGNAAIRDLLLDGKPWKQAVQP
jgi:uncharacterized membrane-anchored protein